MSSHQNQNYSQTLKQNRTNTTSQMFPSKNLAIIITVDENVLTDDVVIEVAKLINTQNGTNMTMYGRLSNNRVCIFLKNQNIVANHIANNYQYIQIENKKFPIRRYITPTKKLIIGNVCPSVPHEIIMEILHQNGIKTVSPMHFMRANLQIPGFEHLLSFRRQVFIPHDDNIDIPTSLLITHDNTQYRMFLNTDTPSCYKCKKQDHRTRDCPLNHTVDNRNTQESNQNTKNDDYQNFQNLNNLIQATNTQSPSQQQTQRQEANPLVEKSTLQQQSQTENTQPEAQISQEHQATPTEHKQSKEEQEKHVPTQPKTQEKSQIQKQDQQAENSNNVNILNQNKAGMSQSKKPQTLNTTITDHTNPTTKTANSSMKRSKPTTPTSETEETEKDELTQSQNKTNTQTSSQNVRKRPNKKPRSSSPSYLLTTDELIYYLKDEITKNQEIYPLNYNEFKDFVDNANGSPDPLEISKDYTNETDKLLQMMESLYPLLQQRTMKHRMTRLIKKIKIQLEEEEEEESD